MAMSVLLRKQLGHFGPTELFGSEKFKNLLGHFGQVEQSFLAVKKSKKRLGHFDLTQRSHISTDLIYPPKPEMLL